MSKAIDKLARAVHIKRHTEGTSNEISFNVLEAAAASEQEKAKTRPAFPLLKSKKNENRGKSSSKKDPASEVARRKTSRIRRKVLLWVVCTLTFVAFAGTLSVHVYREFQLQQEHKNQLNSAIEKMQEADSAILAMNEAVDGDTLGYSQEELQQLSDDLSGTENILTEAAQWADSAREGVSDTASESAAEEVISSVEARKKMVDEGLFILGEAESAVAARDSARQGWQRLLSGDALAREAATLVSDPTTENIQTSMEKSNEALNAFYEAETLFEQAADTYPQSDLTSYQNYIAKRIEGQQYALASDQALIDRNKEEAATQNDAYNSADQEAVALAEQLSDDPGQVVEEAFDDATATSKESYLSARLAGASADAFLRDYLGVSDE